MSVIKNSSSELPNSITKGRLVIGNDNVNYGPTSTSGYYSGVSVPENGYVFYRTTSGGKLNAFIANNDSELISMVTRISNTNITTAQDALNWLFNNSEYFIKNKEIPSIVSDDLLLYFDFGLLDCYPQSGDTLDSTTLYFSNGTLNNSPTYLSDFGGLFNFNDSLSQHATTSNIPSLPIWAIEVWFRLGASLNGKETAIVTRALSGGRANYAIGTLDAPNSYNLCVGFYNNTWRKTDGFIPDVDTWYQVIGTYDGTTIKQYVNGVFLNEFEDPDLPTTGFASDNYFMRRWNPFTNTAPTNYANGDLAVVRVYNRPLTATEVQRNYDAEKDRFTELTPISGAVLYYDPSNPSSYIGTGTTVNDLSGNGLNGTLLNVTHTSPEFNFNGTSSQISVADNALLEPGSGDWTMEAWVYLSNTSGSKVILGKFDNGGLSADVSYSIRVSGANIYAQFGDGSGSFVNSTGFTASVNTWYQVVYVWKNVSVNNIETFINGTSIGNVSHSLPFLLNSTNPMYIGSYNGGEFSQYMNGKIGTVRIYNSALTSAEVLQNFNADKTKYGL